MGQSVVELVTVGYLTLDDLVLTDGRLLRETLGGGALFSAAGAQVWGHAVGIHSCSGGDYPDAHRRTIEAAGINLAGVEVGPPRGLRLWLLEEGTLRKQQLPKMTSASAEEMDVARGSLPAAYQQARGFHVAPSLPATQLTTVRTIRETVPEAVITLDVWTEPFFDATPYLDPDFLTGVDAFLPSDKEVEALWGLDDPASAVRRLADLGPRVVALKRGEDGSLVYDRSRDVVWDIPSVPVTAVDTTGAGDAYCGGFLAGLVTSGDALEAALQGTVSASFAVEDYGAQAAMGTDPAEVRRRLERLRPRVRRADG
ncbi:MAG: carbohydrate kinase family protein [Chloroflexia bacterium]|jgi:ribokinase|nr:carbohydrate kinase family protein [Chloroflexia bacterium]